VEKVEPLAPPVRARRQAAAHVTPVRAVPVVAAGIPPAESVDSEVVLLSSGVSDGTKRIREPSRPRSHIRCPLNAQAMRAM
jgi:hypothetical protein